MRKMMTGMMKKRKMDVSVIQEGRNNMRMILKMITMKIMMKVKEWVEVTTTGREAVNTEARA